MARNRPSDKNVDLAGKGAVSGSQYMVAKRLYYAVPTGVGTQTWGHQEKNRGHSSQLASASTYSLCELETWLLVAPRFTFPD